MECEQRGLLECEVSLLKGLECAAGDHGTEIIFRAGIKRGAAMRIAQTGKTELLCCGEDDRDDHQLGNVAFVGIRHACSGQGPTPLLDLWSGQHKFMPPHSPHFKELSLLMHVSATTLAGDPASVCRSVEDFGEQVLGRCGSFLKVAGGSKAEVLTAAMRRAPSRGSILEIGTYCGFSAIRMATACRGVLIVTLEIDPAIVVIARSMIAFAGLAHVVDVWTGQSKDLLHRLRLRYRGNRH